VTFVTLGEINSIHAGFGNNTDSLATVEEITLPSD